MSVTRLLVCGLLVASGLILAAFTLHGAFDGRPVGTAAGPALKPWSTSTFGAKGGLVAVSADAPEPGSSKAQPPGTGPKRGAGPSGAAAPDAKAAKKKRRTAKRPAEPTKKAKPQPQQTASQWPWSWFGN